jgi:phosphosulfolactate synthase
MSRTNGFLDLPERAPKPREQSLTHVMDKGMSITQIEGL